MNDMVTIRISRQDLTEVLQAYHTIKTFLEKTLSPNELYREKFLHDLQQAQNEVENGQYEEVETFGDFIR
jgi:hypothetical protein